MTTNPMIGYDTVTKQPAHVVPHAAIAELKRKQSRRAFRNRFPKSNAVLETSRLGLLTQAMAMLSAKHR